jgi:membrane protein DedA with SNARE-associated domain
VLDPSHLFQHMGYAAILVIVLLSNAGVPAPEESVLVLGGYLAWHGRLHLPLVILVGVVSASLGHNLGFWAGRRYGLRAISRLPLPPARVTQAQGLIARYGARAAFAARFAPGLRTVAEPLAGAGGLPPLRFLAANLLGAICYVPWPVLAGYGVGYGLGDWIERLRRAVGLEKDTALFAAILVVTALAFFVAGGLTRFIHERALCVVRSPSPGPLPLGGGEGGIAGPFSLLGERVA